MHAQVANDFFRMTSEDLKHIWVRFKAFMVLFLQLNIPRPHSAQKEQHEHSSEHLLEKNKIITSTGKSKSYGFGMT